ncbi:MAG: sensor domain-containing diguanylate cyclase [Acidobacteria bacterium]|nr:sensor domain-containing diguanylate cyclase [Acidobacteriota bacterium]MCA1637450.1 sensor domain-containing diguanylate cyclase [Acidobacteriota bacterium]
MKISVTSEMEILRLRKELFRRDRLARAIQKLNEIVKEVDKGNFWSRLMPVIAEIMRAERISLFVFDEKSNSLIARAATGARAGIIKNEKEKIGERIAKNVLKSGKPLVVPDTNKIDFSDSTLNRKYKMNSFISYPFAIGERKIGVLNITDKADRKNFSEFDLELLNTIMPQVAVLIDLVSLKDKAGEFEQLSVTDALTGLLNRRYLEERVAEEIKRSKRHEFPICFLMIDIDDFKSYNDNFSHPEGDKALKIVGRCLQENLRGADVAARYGGDEFSILLPQTTPEEAKMISERIREKVETTKFPKRKVTVSVGIAGCSQIVCTPQKLIEAADEALYDAKRRGKNNVQVCENLKTNSNFIRVPI